MTTNNYEIDDRDYDVLLYLDEGYWEGLGGTLRFSSSTPLP